MKQVPIVISSTLSNQTETVPSSGRAVSLLIPGKLVLETTTDPTRFELGKESVFVNLDSENPATSEEIDITTKLATVSKANSVIVQVRLELLQLSSANFLCVLLLHRRSGSTGFDLILLLSTKTQTRHHPTEQAKDQRENSLANGSKHLGHLQQAQANYPHDSQQ